MGVWFDIHGARAYLGQGQSRPVNRKLVYGMVRAGMKVARVGEGGRRLVFSSDWIDEFLEEHASAGGVAPALRST